jgi:hypothetical protein
MLIFYLCRAKKVQEARVYAEQELNKYRVEYEERYASEAARVFIIGQVFTMIIENRGE